MYGLSSHLNHHSFFLKLNACHKSDNHWLADVSLNNEEDFYDDAEKSKEQSQEGHGGRRGVWSRIAPQKIPEMFFTYLFFDFLDNRLWFL